MRFERTLSLSFTVENAESVLRVLCSERQNEEGEGRTGYQFSMITLLATLHMHSINNDAEFSCRNENLPARILWSRATKIDYAWKNRA